MNRLKLFLVRKVAEKEVDDVIKESQMSAPMKSWLVSFANAAISGLASGGAGLTLGVDWKHSLGIAAVSIVFSLVKWVAQHPIPGGGQ